MKITVNDLKQDRQWRAALGVSEAQFKTLLPPFTAAYFAQYQAGLAERKVDVNIEYCISSEEGLLLFSLFSLKIGTSHDFSILKTEFPPHLEWFAKFHIKVDLGYLGIT
jgi:hypothetical protein